MGRWVIPQMQMNPGGLLSWPRNLQSRPHMCLSIVPFNLIACSPQAIAGEIGMDNVLDNIANSLFNGLLPAAWSKLAPATCKQLASWLEHLRVSRSVVESSRASPSTQSEVLSQALRSLIS